MLDVYWIDQGDQCVDIKQVDRHCFLSRNRFTRSSVAGVASFRFGSSCTPLRTAGALRDAPPCRPCLAKAEMTSPMLLLWRSAKCLAATKTSSSIAKVVRMRRTGVSSDAEHHASRTMCVDRGRKADACNDYETLHLRPHWPYDQGVTRCARPSSRVACVDAQSQR